MGGEHCVVWQTSLTTEIAEDSQSRRSASSRIYSFHNGDDINWRAGAHAPCKPLPFPRTWRQPRCCGRRGNDRWRRIFLVPRGGSALSDVGISFHPSHFRGGSSGSVVLHVLERTPEFLVWTVGHSGWDSGLCLFRVAETAGKADSRILISALTKTAGTGEAPKCRVGGEKPLRSQGKSNANLNTHEIGWVFPRSLRLLPAASSWKTFFAFCDLFSRQHFRVSCRFGRATARLIGGNACPRPILSHYHKGKHPWLPKVRSRGHVYPLS